ncbi:MAG: zinc-binding dehydrogenase [Pseudomonadota bacterium]|nr:zinc-binding dehydrogenase [Pseudomonadota bacterium]
MTPPLPARRHEIDAPGPDARLALREVAVPPPGPGEARIRTTRIGVNFVDVYHLRGVYPLPALPGAPGVEATGEVEALGPGVRGLEIGDRVAVVAGAPGAYATARTLPAARLARMPDGLDPARVAGAALRALTARMLLTRLRPVGPGDAVLITAAAGGLGGALAALARARGALTIGTAGSPAKAETARAHGLDHVLVGRGAALAARLPDAVRDLTGGEGASLAVDGVGGPMLAACLAALRPFGVCASVGQAAGAPPAPALSELTNRGLHRPSVIAWLADPDRFRAEAEAWFADLLADPDGPGAADVAVHRFEEAPTLLAALEAGETSGPLALVP